MNDEENFPMSVCGASVVRNTAKRKCIANSPKDLQPISTGLAKQVVIATDSKHIYLRILLPVLFDGLVASAYSAKND
jgi:hypothetical protein